MGTCARACVSESERERVSVHNDFKESRPKKKVRPKSGCAHPQKSAGGQNNDERAAIIGLQFPSHIK